MSVSAYVDEKTGEQLYKVRVRRASSVQVGLELDKRVKGFKTQDAAEKAERKLYLVVERELIEAEQKGCRWATLVAEWEIAARDGKDVFQKQLNPNTICDYTLVVKIHCKDWLNLHASEIDRAMAWKALDLVERTVSVSRRKRLRIAIDAIFRWAILSGRLKGVSSLPTEGFKGSIKEEEKMPEILNLTQIRALLKYAGEINHDWFFHWALALFTGMRSGELYALQWDQVDFENNLIFVHRNWTSKTGFGPTKGRYWRSVPIGNEQILSLLKQLKVKAGDDKFVLHHFHEWSRGGQARVLRAFCQGCSFPSIKFHTLRACWATQLIRDRVASGVVMKMGGWKDIKTMQRYIRLAGIEVEGGTASLKLLPEKEVADRAVELFKSDEITVNN
jgi:integrase